MRTLEPTNATSPVAAPPWWWVPAGAAGGLALGVAARLWMRSISSDPEFSWGGTLGIVIGFGLFGLLQATAACARARLRRRVPLALTRLVGVAGLLPLFVGAGGIMLPTVVGAGLAGARPAWRPRVRLACLGVAAVPVAFVVAGIGGDHGWSLRTLAGTAGLLALYAAVARVARPTFAPGPGRPARRSVVGLAVAVGALAMAVAARGLG